jgi:hypothetical protein
MGSSYQANPESDKLIPVEPKDSLVTIRDPNKVLKEAIKAAEALKKVIDAKPHKIILNGETYLENEDWLTVARFYGVTSRIRSTKYVTFGEGEFAVRGFEAIAEAFLVERGEVISMAESMCLNDEKTWGSKPLFQLRSMAQTRASSRVLRQVLGWVVVLAGYKATPAEEMQQNGMPFTKGKLCYECGEDVMEEESVNTKRKYGKTLCRICAKLHDRAAEGKVMAPIQDPNFVRNSVQQVRGKPQPVAKVIDQAPDELTGN